ncbi:hypothetical protein H4582DRAFT_2092518 [Lactarius indigo]|nr:hypothetical protein H4582DRAFT_2092518 [Lactarius indigo]
MSTPYNFSQTSSASNVTGERSSYSIPSTPVPNGERSSFNFSSTSVPNGERSTNSVRTHAPQPQYHNAWGATGTPQTPARRRNDTDYGNLDFSPRTELPSEVSPSYIEAVAKSMGFSVTDEEYRNSLHSIPKIAVGMPRGHMQLHIYQTALLFTILKECRSLADTCRTDRAMMADLHIRLEGTFNLSQEQRMNIRLVSGEVLLDANRVRYTRMNIDVEVKLQERQKELHLFNVFGNLSWQRLLMTTIRRTCSSLRNAYREMLRDSVIGSNTQTLDDFVCNVTNRFLATWSGRHTLGHPIIAHIALLRRFALENPQLLDRVGEDKDKDNDNQTNQGDDTSRSTSSAVDGDTGVGSRPSSAMSIGPPRGKKCKRTGTPGTPTPPQQKGNDFWSMVDKWFTAHIQKLGTPWSSPGWTRYIEETIERDRSRFTSDANVNPFLDNFTSADGDNADEDAGGDVSGGFIGAIGSMASILEHA